MIYKTHRTLSGVLLKDLEEKKYNLEYKACESVFTGVHMDKRKDVSTTSGDCLLL